MKDMRYSRGDLLMRNGVQVSFKTIPLLLCGVLVLNEWNGSAGAEGWRIRSRRQQSSTFWRLSSHDTLPFGRIPARSLGILPVHSLSRMARPRESCRQPAYWDFRNVRGRLSISGGTHTT